MKSVFKSDFFLSFAVLFQMIVVTIQLLLPLLGITDTETAAKYRILITLVTYMPGIIILLQKKWSLLAITFSNYFLFLFFNYAFFPDSHQFIEGSQAYTLTPISLLSILFMKSIKDFSVFTKILLWISRASFILSLAYLWACNYSSFRDYDDAYSMSFGYSMLLPAMYLFTQSTLDRILSFILFVLILLLGSRGPIVVLAMYYAVDMLFLNKVKDKAKMIALAILVVVVGLAFLPRYVDLESSRTLNLLNQGVFVSHDSGREEVVYSKIRPYLYDSPIFGHGVGADRLFLDGSYAHNIFYEVLVQYGFFCGSVLIISFFLWLLKMFRNRIIKNYLGGRPMFIMMLLYGFVPLLVSNSYLISFPFCLMMGYYFKLSSYAHLAYRKHLCY